MSKSAIAVLYLHEESMVEIKDHEDTKKHLDYLVNHDVLTGLPNRHFLMSKLHSLLDESSSNNSFLSVLYIDLNGFKSVNDNYGHAVGDELLKEVAKRLKTHESYDQIVARIGGDEFVVIVCDKAATETKANKVSCDLMKLLSEDYQINEVTYKNIGASIGQSHLVGKSDTADSLLKAADAAMYLVKKSKN